MEDAALNALDAAATLLANPATRAEELSSELERLAASRALQAAPVAPTEPSTEREVAPAAAQEKRRAPVRTPTGKQLHALLEDGLTRIRELEDQPRVAALASPDEGVVPIEQLLYRGRTALMRATELRDEIRRSGAAPSTDAVQELFDLLDLALIE
jgi:hypothetical protein